MKLEHLSRPECHLCREAEAALNALGVDFATINVENNPELIRRFGDAIPVLLADGVEVMRAPMRGASLRLARIRLGAATRD